MDSSLTEEEMNAVMQLIQLSGGDCGGDTTWMNDSPAKKMKLQKQAEENGEESVGETSSSTVINPVLEEALPRRRKRTSSIADIYRRTKPLIQTSQI